jgi:MoxR-like ATPase
MAAQTATTTATTTTTAQAQLQQLRQQMHSAFIGRDAEIDGLLLALLGRTHCLLLGPPGTAKSLVTQVFAAALGGDYFQLLLTGFTTPDEVFGGPDLQALDRGEGLRRSVQGYLPTATTAFLDECFKANSAVLNALLTMLNERAFDNGGKRIACPLQLCVGASNEYPADASLEALYDRFQLRYWTDYVPTRSQRLALLTCADPATQVTAQLTLEQVVELQQQVRTVQVPQQVLEGLLDVAEALASQHGLTVSDRRLRAAVKLVQARAVLHGRTVATMRDLLVLADSVWHRHEQRPAVLATVLQVAAPALQQAQQLADAALEAHEGVQDWKDLNAVQRTLGTIKRIERELGELACDDSDVEVLHEQVVQIRKAVARQFIRASGLPGGLG